MQPYSGGCAVIRRAENGFAVRRPESTKEIGIEAQRDVFAVALQATDRVDVLVSFHSPMAIQ